MKKYFITVLLLFVVASPVNACIGARQAAMGWCGVAISDDATCSYWNPAALVWAKDGFYIGRIYTSNEFAFKYNKLGFHFVDNWLHTYFAMSYAQQINANSAWGINIGWNDFSRSDENYVGPSLDLSYITKCKCDNLTVGLLLQNGYVVRPGIAYKNEYLLVTFEGYDLLNLYDFSHFLIGAELTPFPFIAFRIGYDQLYNDFTYGVGIKTSLFSLDYTHFFNEDCFSLSLFF